MDTSRRAVESYWRSRMIDAVTSDEDKVAPVYKLEEICDLLRSSHVSIVKEFSEFILKRLDNKSPIVKQKVRMKALCVLEAILRKKEDDNFSIVHSYFDENMDAIQRCSESPQSSLREKANKVLNLLNGGQSSGLMSSSDNTVKREAAVDLPDLIDTGYSDYTTEDILNQPNIIDTGSTVATAAPLMDDDWFGDSTDTGMGSSEKKNDDDPFADVSFHPNEEKESADDLFSGMTVGEKSAAGDGNHVPELFDMFGSTANLEAEPKESKNINDLMASFSIDENNSNQKGSSSSTLPDNLFAMPSTTSHQGPENPVGGIVGSQNPGFIQNSMLPGGVMPFNFPPGMMMNPAFAQPMNYAAMASLLAQQQQYLGNISNFQQFGNLNAQGSGNVHSMGTSGGNQSALPDIFQPNFANQAPTSTMNGSKKEDTRAFDFISDHIASARDTKRVS
ncbi:hypothetical protein CARUB_v10015684mg [Capsella rubella]|uniref:VHS domain-containing protein n=1 Tax=Capsella rubella TaxID=81985 RepID=R0G9R9_9BRAS|nr:hypothetical protein CARUB_v10015684mg [Capsella rubella]